MISRKLGSNKKFPLVPVLSQLGDGALALGSRSTQDTRPRQGSSSPSRLSGYHNVFEPQCRH